MKPPRPQWLEHPHTPDNMGLDQIIINYEPQVKRSIIKAKTFYIILLKTISLNVNNNKDNMYNSNNNKDKMITHRGLDCCASLNIGGGALLALHRGAPVVHQLFNNSYSIT